MSAGVNTRKDSSTAIRPDRLPVELIFSEHYARLDEAIAAERRIKGCTRAKKEAYIRGDFSRLSELARRKGKEP
jgi:putative endonuclease